MSITVRPATVFDEVGWAAAHPRRDETGSVEVGEESDTIGVIDELG